MKKQIIIITLFLLSVVVCHAQVTPYSTLIPIPATTVVVEHHTIPKVKQVNVVITQPTVIVPHATIRRMDPIYTWQYYSTRRTNISRSRPQSFPSYQSPAGVPTKILNDTWTVLFPKR